MVCVFEGFSQHDVTRRARERRVPHTPGVRELIRDACQCVQDLAPPRVRCFVHCAEGSDEIGKRAVAGNHFHDSLYDPDGRERSSFGSLPAVVGDGVQRADPSVPFLGGLDHRGDVARGDDWFACLVQRGCMGGERGLGKGGNARR